jgi:hypothetical protein
MEEGGEGVRHGLDAQWRRGLVEQKLGRGGSGGVRAAWEVEEQGGTCGPRVQAWANQRREGAGPGPRATVPFLI